MKDRRKLTLVVAAVALGVALLATAGVAIASSDDADTPITGPALEQASQAALEHLGQGTVTETEVGDEESMYEVEVTLPDGSQVDVQLDEAFNVVGADADTDDTSDGD